MSLTTYGTRSVLLSLSAFSLLQTLLQLKGDSGPGGVLPLVRPNKACAEQGSFALFDSEFRVGFFFIHPGRVDSGRRDTSMFEQTAGQVLSLRSK